MIVPVLTAVSAVALLGGFSLLIRRLMSRAGDTESSIDWLESFDALDYRPMQRLLDERDYRFLESQPGYEPLIARRLRTERRRIFREYLHRMVHDFHRLLAVARLFMVHSPVDRPDFASAISVQRRRFYWNVLSIECRLALQPLGVRPPDVRALIGSLQQMHASLAGASR